MQRHSVMQKGQVTIFIILGAVLVLSALLVFVFLRTPAFVVETQNSAIATLNTVVIKDYVTACLAKVTEESVRKTALRGGFLNPLGNTKYNEIGDELPSEIHYFFGSESLPYLYFEKTSRLRPINIIKQKLANYVMVEMQNCLNFEQWEKQGYMISRPIIDRITSDGESGVPVAYSSTNESFNAVNARIELTDDATVVFLQYPLVFEQRKLMTRQEVNEFTTQIPLRLKLVYSIAEKLLKSPISDVYEINKHCNDYSSSDRMVNVYVRKSDYDYDYVVQIVDAKPALSKILPLKFQFATRNAKIEGECVG